MSWAGSSIMPVAVQTISWGRRPNVSSMLQDIRKAGYDGVELGQIPSLFDPIDEFWDLLKLNRLRLIGIASGSLKDKMDFVTKFTFHQQRMRLLQTQAGRFENLPTYNQHPYIYIDDWHPDSRWALDQGYRLALHPHMFRPFQTEQDFKKYFDPNAKEYERLEFLPDTAHLTVAGEDIVQIVDRYFDRIEAIHIKDWTGEWGRAYAFYSRGFTELGTGDVRLLDVLRLLKSRNYRKWLVIEQDTSDNPLESATRSRNWLRKEFNFT
jgi:sugar phosphate isomerase/epimerase